MAKKSVLGRGINALIPEHPEGTDSETLNKRIVYINIDEIKPNPFQARTEFDPDHINELMQSIIEKGVIQPISVYRVNQMYHLIAGERRWRATRQAGIDTIPAIIHEVESDQDLMELSLIENIQRENLSPIEEAEGYRSLIDNCYLTQEQVAQKVGKNRSTVANLLRLLKLPPELQTLLRQGKLQMGHARALLGIEDEESRVKLGLRAAEEQLSAREIERTVNSTRKKSKPRKPEPDHADNTNLLIRAQEEKLQLQIGTGVRIRTKGERGCIEIDFYSMEDLERVLELLHHEN